jgi:hypothetical protein
MRGSIAAIAFLWLATSVEVQGAGFPYTATVTSLNVTARSGPGFGAYPTERLAKHSQVQVVQSGTAGWVAISPPEDAFDWLPTSSVKISEDRKQGEIIADHAPAYIGSNVRKIDKHLSQTDLKKGEVVQVLAEKSGTDGAGTWLKIVPPAGEFRWVQTKHLSTQSPHQLAAAETEDRLAREERYRRENALDPPGLLAGVLRGRENDVAAWQDETIERAQFLRRGKSPLLTRKPRENSNRAAEESVGPLEISKGAPSAALDREVVQEASPGTSPLKSSLGSKPQSRVSLDPKDLDKTDKPFAGTDADQPAASATLASPLLPETRAAAQEPPIDVEEFKKRLRQLDVDLTSLVAEDSSKWNLTPLRQRAEALVELGPTPLERGKARLLLERIAEFAATLPAGQEEAALSTSVGQPAASPAVKQADFVTQYDAVGYLMPIVGARPGTPQYQLTDKDGRSLSLVSARPGVNLNAYVKKQVGVFGQRGYIESLKKHHVLAERVVDLELHRR